MTVRDCQLPIANCRMPEKEGQCGSARISNRQSAIGNRQSRRGFTLTEILIVIGLIVLMIALAVPTLSFLTGSRSVEGAQNNVSAMLGRARAEAIGLQEVRGVFFFLEKSTGRVAMALVREVQPPTTTFTPHSLIASPPPEVWLDLVPESEFVTLPSGVGLQVIDECIVNAADPTQRLEDGYIGFNVRNAGNGTQDVPTHTAYGGVILFDGSGQLVSRRHAFKTFIQTTSGREATRMGDLLYRPTGDPAPLANHATSVDDVVVMAWNATGSGRPGNFYPKSHIGIVLFEAGPARTNFPPPSNGDPIYTGEFERDPRFEPGGPSTFANSGEKPQEEWLDNNGLALLVNRYNGTLVRAQ